MGPRWGLVVRNVAAVTRGLRSKHGGAHAGPPTPHLVAQAEGMKRSGAPASWLQPSIVGLRLQAETNAGPNHCRTVSRSRSQSVLLEPPAPRFPSGCRPRAMIVYATIGEEGVEGPNPYHFDGGAHRRVVGCCRRMWTVQWWNGNVVGSGHGGPGAALISVSCPTTSQCMAIDSHGRLVSLVRGVWSSGTAIPGAESSANSQVGISCVTVTWCQATLGNGTMAVFAGPTWTSSGVVDKGGDIVSLSCPTTRSARRWTTTGGHSPTVAPGRLRSPSTPADSCRTCRAQGRPSAWR